MGGFLYRIALLLLLTASTVPVAVSQQLFLPGRPVNALNGTQIISLLTPLSQQAREDTIFNQIRAGNIPDFMRNLIEVSDTETVSGQPMIIKYYVTPDYMALGCDSDYFLCPMTPLLAQKVADYTSCILPTRKMVNQIWRAATVKLSPQTISPSPEMVTVPVFADHDSMVWNSRSAQIPAHPLGELVGGDKKDVIISNQIYGHPAPGRVVIYGWHYLSGTPIQPLYYGHEETYADYSHGIRLVLSDMLLNDSLVPSQEMLASSSLNVLLSDEGAISVPRYPVTVNTVSVPQSFAVLGGLNQVTVLRKPDASLRGCKVVFASDAKHFSLPQFFSADSFVFSGNTADSLLYIRIAAMGADGGVSNYSEVLAGSTFNASDFSDQWLIVNGFDRASAGNTYDFVRLHAPHLMRLPDTQGVSSCTNEAMCDSIVSLSDFRAVDYLLGEESSVTESLNSAEQAVIKDFLTSSGKLFISGSEIGWDLGNLGTASDSLFYSQVLHASYIEDSPGGTASSCYSFTTTFGDFDFDNGTHGTYNVDYPDVVSAADTAATTVGLIGEYTGFAGSACGVYVSGSLVYLAVPFETIYPQSSAAVFIHWTDSILFPVTTDIADAENSFGLYPNPAEDFVYLRGGSHVESVSVFDVSGKIVIENIQLVPGIVSLLDVSFLQSGLYFVRAQNGASKRLLIIRD